jgi:hypothetical protein
MTKTNKIRVSVGITIAVCLVTMLIFMFYDRTNYKPVENTPLEFIHDEIESSISSKEAPLANISTGNVKSRLSESDQLSFVEDEILERAGGSVETALFEKRISDPRNFIKLKWAHGTEYKCAREVIGQDKLPILYDMLEDPNYARYWNNVAELIGYVSNDVNSVPVLLRYIQRDDTNAWDWKSNARYNGYRMIMGKVRVLEWIGKIGGNRADPILRDALTEEGAQRLTKAWIDSELPVLGKKGGRKEVIQLIRGRAAQGLIYSQKAENINLVKKCYGQVHADYQASETIDCLYNGIVSAIAEQAFIEDHDLESRFNLWGSGLEGNSLDSYVKKYHWYLQEK